MSERGILIILSGFSGAGKGTIVKELLRRYPEKYVLSISATTRKPREGEQHGREYFFKSVEEFEAMIANNELLEHAKYVDNYYGTPRFYVEDMLSQNKNVILEIEMQGALKVKEHFPEALMLFIAPPSAEELRRRLVNRGTETEEVIASRLARAAEEAAECKCYDYLIINDDLDRCVEEVHQLFESQRSRMFYHYDKIDTMKQELEAYRKELD